MQQSPMSRRRVVIIGAGFAGLSAAKALAEAPVDVIVIDRHNYHLFQPLLYQVATAGLSPADIASPIRSVLSRQANTTVILAEVDGIDAASKTVRAEDRDVSYDFLIVATGAKHSYFAHDDWAKFAPGLKRIDDATVLRRHILLAFEKAEIETDARRTRASPEFRRHRRGSDRRRNGRRHCRAVAQGALGGLSLDRSARDEGGADRVRVRGCWPLFIPICPMRRGVPYKCWASRCGWASR